MDCSGRWLISSIGFKARRTIPSSQSDPNHDLAIPSWCSILSDWNQIYRASNGPPWDIGRPQPAFVSLVKNHEIVPPGTVLDVGCGTGENAIFYAKTNSQFQDWISLGQLSIKRDRRPKRGMS